MKARGALTVLVQAAGCICGCLLAFVVALNLTLFREGYYLHQLEKSGCLQTVYENICQASRTIARTAGLREDILDGLVTQEDVTVAVTRRADELWHGSTTQPATPFADLVTYLQDTVTQETGQMWTDADTARYQIIQEVCEDTWRTNAVPPMANLLSMLMQYRQVAWILVAVLAALFVICLGLQFPLQRHWQQLGDALAGVGVSVALGTVLICLGMGLSGWESWMPSTDAAYRLYLLWLRGLGPVVAACGFALAALVWLAALLPYEIARLYRDARRHPNKKGGKTS